MYSSSICAQILKNSSGPSSSLEPGIWGWPTDVTIGMNQSGSISHTLKGSYWLVLMANLEQTYSIVNFGPSIFILENLENLTDITRSQGKCRILPLFSQNDFYIGEQSENQPGND